MAPKRRRRVSSPKGLNPEDLFKQRTLLNNTQSYWGWVGTEVSQVSDITHEHRLATCGFTNRNAHPFCVNKFFSATSETPLNNSKEHTQEDDVIIVHVDGDPPCGKKGCRNNPNCLNYLGQEAWEDAG